MLIPHAANDWEVPMAESAEATTAIDANAWLRRWDRQQGAYVSDREAVFASMLDIVGRLTGAPRRILDVGCGLGALAGRAAERFPEADVLALDFDPVMLELGRQTLGDRVQWLDANLLDPAWHESLGGAPLDAVVSATALHWLGVEQLGHVAARMAERLRVGGVFVDYDVMLTDPSNPRLAELAEALRVERVARATAAPGVERYATWWAALEAEPALRELFAERQRRFGDTPHGIGTTITQVEHGLREAGFAEVATLAQTADRRLLVAIR